MGKLIHNLTLISKDTNKKIVIKELDSSLTAKDLLDRFAENINPSDDISDVLIRKLTHYELQPYETLTSAEIEDDEILIASVGFRGGGGILVRNFRDVQLVEGVLRQSRDIFDPSMGYTNRLFAVFLYTSEDEELTSYIRNHIRDLHEMSGSDCTFFL